MKLIQSAAIGVCLFTSLSGQTQQTNEDTASKLSPPVIEKNQDTALQSESKKEEYKSKEWKQGTEMPPEEKNGKVKSKMQKKAGKQQGVPPPPTPPPAAPATPAVPPAPPAPPAKD